MRHFSTNEIFLNGVKQYISFFSLHTFTFGRVNHRPIKITARDEGEELLFTPSSRSSNRLTVSNRLNAALE